MTTQHLTQNQDHDYVWELLPWYVTDGISPHELNEVETHLKDCMTCQQEVARCRELNQSVKTNQKEVWTPSPAHFTNILANVDAFENRRIKSQRASGWFANWFPWLVDTPRPARFALALQGAFVVALATTLLVGALVPTPGYQTLSSPDEPAATSAQRMRLVFADNITEKELRELLLGISARLIAGPTPLGVYTIAMNPSATNPLPIQQTLAQLRAHPKVRLAEIAGVATQ
jgi:anti-sigma factor RsiW